MQRSMPDKSRREPCRDVRRLAVILGFGLPVRSLLIGLFFLFFALMVFGSAHGLTPPAALAAEAPANDELLTAAQQLQTKYAGAIEELARWCESKGMHEQAAKTRAWRRSYDPYKVYVYLLPHEFSSFDAPAGSPPDVVEWHRRFGELRKQQAAALYELAKRCIRGRRASLAYELVLAAGREDPENEAVRRVFGFQKGRDGWYTAYEQRKLRAGQVWHDRFGWIPKTFVKRYEEGQRYSDNRWVSAEFDAKSRRDIKNGWEIETEHYNIRTNHSLEAGVALGVKLERFYRIWSQLFVRYYASEASVAALFDGRAKPPAAEPPKLTVVYFRDREDYLTALRTSVPNVEISVGTYLANTQCAYFFAGDQSDDRTLYHEATHQLFHQSRPVAANVGRNANFWIIEGIALYMESLRPEGEYWVLGGQDDIRMEAARVRVLRDRFYVPFAEMAGYGMERLQAHPQIATLYSQMAGQTHFLICHDQGKYRDALVSYLSAVYSGNDDPAALAKLIGETYLTLDKQYLDFIVEAEKAEQARKKALEGAKPSAAPGSGASKKAR